MLQFPLWKKLVIWGLCLLGVAAAAPNLFYDRVEQHNDALARIEKTGVTSDADATARAHWPGWLPSNILSLGLDLRGGAHLLAEVKLEDVYKSRMQSLWPEMRKVLGEKRAEIGGVRRAPSADGELKIQIEKPEALAAAVAAAKTLSAPVVSLTGVGQSTFDITGEGNTITVRLSEAEKVATNDRTMQQALEIIRRRVDAAGTREPTILRQGSDRILIQVPGLGSAEELKALIGTTAKLTFQPVIGRTQDANAAPGAGNVLAPAEDEPGTYYILEDRPVVSGDDLVNAAPSFDQNGAPAVSFNFDTTGARAFGQYTAENIGQLFAIVLDGKVISAPRIQSAIPGGSGIITGNFTVQSSTDLAVLLRSGALPAGLNFLEQRTIGPELGQDSIDAGRVSTVVAMAAVSAFMIASYGLFGAFAIIALTINMAMLLGGLTMIGATLTLPGIAGIVLTIGMAVDANVLIFERIREELRAAKSPARAIELGYERALPAIIDANLTTMITALVLFFVGAGPVRGFAVTLALGIITSVFTAIYVTRLLIVAWYDWRRPKSITV
jgi:preprotein translocase subunit SecD